MNTSPPSRPGVWPVGLGYAGLIPFVALAALLWMQDGSTAAFAARAMAAYGATIASFLGAIHWGLAMRGGTDRSLLAYAWGVVPSLVAWYALLSAAAVGLATLGVLLWACYGVDRVVYPRYRVQHWLALRLRLTLVASASCFAAAAGVLR